MTDSKVVEIIGDVKNTSQSTYATLMGRKKEVVIKTIKATQDSPKKCYKLEITLPAWMPDGDVYLDRNKLVEWLDSQDESLVLSTLQAGIAGRLINVWALARPKVEKKVEEDFLRPSYPADAQKRISEYLPSLDKKPEARVDKAMIQRQANIDAGIKVGRILEGMGQSQEQVMVSIRAAYPGEAGAIEIALYQAE